jgi:mono/diheme cytochrome c family protein
MCSCPSPIEKWKLARASRATTLMAPAVALVTSCSMPQRGATASDIAQAQSLAPEGSLIYESYCAECHGLRGAGTGKQPAIMGDQSLMRYTTAFDLYEYVHGHMPKGRKAELSPKDYWAVVDFVVRANGEPVPESGLSSSNAARVRLHTD